jgi:alcohol dehydrogenase
MGIQKFLAPEFVFGPGARKLCGRYLRNLGARRVLVVSDSGVAESGWTDEAVLSLEAEGHSAVRFQGVRINPRMDQVEEGTRLYRDSGCDAVLAVGGGSPIDCAKAIGVMSANPGSIADYEGIDRIPRPGPPLVCIPTTAGSAAEVSQFAIIGDEGRRIKMAIVSRVLVPDVALIDPETTVTLDPFQTAAGGIDALTHAIEAYVSNVSSPITDIHAVEAMRTVEAWLPRCIAEPKNLEARTEMLRASLEAGLAFSNAILGLAHALSHAIGGMFDSSHGEANGILLPEVVRFNYPASAAKYDLVARIFGVEPLASPKAADLLADRLAAFAASIGITARLGGQGISLADLPALAERAARDPCALTNPREASIRDIEDIYERCI